jgi:hypothetical protein
MSNRFDPLAYKAYNEGCSRVLLARIRTNDQRSDSPGKSSKIARSERKDKETEEEEAKEKKKDRRSPQMWSVRQNGKPDQDRVLWAMDLR